MEGGSGWCRVMHEVSGDRLQPWPGSARQISVRACALAKNALQQYAAEAGENRQFGEQLGPTRASRAMAIVHAELVLIHPWPNGNGRHAREATDLLLRRWRRPAFSWGAASKHAGGQEARQEYLRALRAADAGDLEPLMRFVRS